MADEEHQAEAGVPEYMISYADMLTIMLAFFVVLYASTSASGTKDKGGKSGEQAHGGKEPAAAQGVTGTETGRELSGPDQGASDARMKKIFDSLYDRFGPDWSPRNFWDGGPGTWRNAGAKPNDAAAPGLPRPPRSPPRDDYRGLCTPKPNDNVAAGGRIYFDGFTANLNPEQVKQLRGLAEDLAGKLQKIEIRGHTSRQPLPKGTPYQDHWDLAYARCRSVEQCLVSAGINPERVRLGVAGPNEPLELKNDSLATQQNSRVEIRVLNEWLKAPAGSK